MIGNDGRLFGVTNIPEHALVFLEAAGRDFGAARILDMATGAELSEDDLRRHAHDEALGTASGLKARRNRRGGLNPNEAEAC